MLLSRLARRAVLRRLAHFKHGHLALCDGGSVTHWGDRSKPPSTVTVHDARFYSAVAFGGSIGAGEAYGDGWWSSDDVTGVVRLLLRNRDVLDALESGLARLVTPARRLYHAFNRNTRSRSRRNIAAHYDLSNAFFATFLDETMTYSCALFERPAVSLRAASLAKYERMAQLLDLQPTDHLVEIGTGWGGFAIYAASTYGCRVTTTTISEAQYEFAVESVLAAGLQDRVTVLKRDYRDLSGAFDKLVSIEMIEAVGHEHYDSFFAQCSALVKPDGRAVIQAITIRDERYERARREVDFIKRHIFPGCCIPSRLVLETNARRNGLHMVRTDEIGLHYAETLHRWRDNMLANTDRIEALGFDQRFRRMWDYYFSYCEGGFLEETIGTAQIVFARGGAALTTPLIVSPVPPSPQPVAA